MNTELVKVCEWLNANKLSLNTGKSNFVVFHPYQCKANIDVDLKIFDNDLKMTTCLQHKKQVKYLGVLIETAIFLGDTTLIISH